MIKKKAGRKLDNIEVEEYYKHKYDKELALLHNDVGQEGLPGRGAVIGSIRKYHLFKKNCLMSFYNC